MSLGGGMVDTRDLKSLGQNCPCEFESHPRHKRVGMFRPINLLKYERSLAHEYTNPPKRAFCTY